MTNHEDLEAEMDALDLVALSSNTMNDPDLQVEVLQLFSTRAVAY